MTLARNNRAGFTLVELMVAMTLTLFVMLILTQAFVTSLDTFDGLKGVGDMEGHLRTVATSLRHDLAQDHFEGKRRMSDPDFWNPKNPIKEGFFYIRQHAASQTEGTDSDSIPSYSSFTTGSTPSYHVLYFTSKLRTNQREKVYAASGIPAVSPLLSNPTNYFDQSDDALFLEAADRYHSPWATLAYFLVQTGTSDEIDNPMGTTGTYLHSLYPAEHLLVPNITKVNPTTDSIALYPNVSCVPSAGGNLFNSPATVTSESMRDLDTSVGFVPQRRTVAGMPPAASATPPAGSTLLLTNVISFNVRVLGYVEGASGGLSQEFSEVPGGVFDTGSTSPGYRLHGLEITIRIWDQKTEQARQITIVHGL